MKGEIVSSTERLDRFTLGILGRLAAVDRRSLGSVLIGLVALCRIAPPDNWEGLADVARTSYGVEALGEALDRLSQAAERAEPQLETVFTERLLANSRSLRTVLPGWVTEIYNYREAIWAVDRQGFATWLSGAIETITATSSGGASTPAVLSRLMAEIVAPRDGAVFDPFCRSGELLEAAVCESRRDHGRIKVVGLAQQSEDFALARLRLFFLGADFEIVEADGLREPALEGERLRSFEKVICDPPFGRRLDAFELSFSGARHWLGLDAKVISSDAAYLRLAMAHLGRYGSAAVRVSPGLLFRGGVDAQLRRSMVDQDILAMVVGLPSGLVPGSAIESGLAVLDRAKSKNRAGQVLMVDISDSSPTDLNWVDMVKARIILAGHGDAPNARWVSASELADASFNLHPRTFLRRTRPSGEPMADPASLEEAIALQHEAQALSDEMDHLVEEWRDRNASS